MDLVTIKKSVFVSGRSILEWLCADKFCDFFVLSNQLNSHLALNQELIADPREIGFTSCGINLTGKKSIAIFQNNEALYLLPALDFALSYQLPLCALVIYNSINYPKLTETIAIGGALKPLRFIYKVNNLGELYGDLCQAMIKTLKHQFPAIVLVDEKIFFSGEKTRIARQKLGSYPMRFFAGKDETLNLTNQFLDPESAGERLKKLSEKFEKI